MRLCRCLCVKEPGGRNANIRLGGASVGAIAGWGTMHRQNHSTAFFDYSSAIVRKQNENSFGRNIFRQEIPTVLNRLICSIRENLYPFKALVNNFFSVIESGSSHQLQARGYIPNRPPITREVACFEMGECYEYIRFANGRKRLLSRFC